MYEILMQNEWQAKPMGVGCVALGKRNLRTGPGLKYPVIAKLLDGAIVKLSQYNPWENKDINWKAGVPDRRWALVLDDKNAVIGWVCQYEVVRKVADDSASAVWKQFCPAFDSWKTAPGPQDYLAWKNDLKSTTKAFNAIVDSFKSSGVKIPPERKPLPDSGDAPSGGAMAAIGIGAAALLLWKFWPK
jgi:hypothetical protein